MKLTQTPVEPITVDGHEFYLKRDDLLHRDFSGNKARKFYALLQQDLTGIDKIISYGSPQANSLYSLAVLANLRGVSLDYYVTHIPSFLADHPAGNYLAALVLGANVIDVSAFNGELLSEHPSLESYLHNNLLVENIPNALFIPEGGRYLDAKVGVYLLADELVAWAKTQGVESITVALPSGTGTTALFLQQRFIELGLNFKVLTCACVGGDEYLKTQFKQLCVDVRQHPTLLTAHKKYHFGKLYRQFYQMWLQLTEQTGVTFELLYDPLGWITLLEYVAHCANKSNETGPIVYIHQGGVLGNATMLPRYQRKFSDL